MQSSTDGVTTAGRPRRVGNGDAPSDRTCWETGRVASSLSADRRRSRVLLSARVDLTVSQEEQLQTFLEEQETDQFELRPAAKLPEGYVEASY